MSQTLESFPQQALAELIRQAQQEAELADAQAATSFASAPPSPYADPFGDDAAGGSGTFAFNWWSFLRRVLMLALLLVAIFLARRSCRKLRRR